MKLKNVVLVVVSVILALILCEFSLRIFGFRPGIFRKLSGFEVVDSLILYKNYTTDDAGIYKFSTWVTDSLQRYINPETGEIENIQVKNILRHSDKIEDVCIQFAQLNNRNLNLSFKQKLKRWVERAEEKTEFEIAVEKIKSNPNHDEWEQAVLKYVQHPFNKEGFRSIEFKRHDTKRPRVLIIGDSFVYGMSASPFYNSFTDLLLARGYMIYAAGIPGTDPAQYAAIAQKYIPALKPDIVIVCFYEGNDLMKLPRIPSKAKPHEHMTNAGFYDSSPMGEYMDAKAAYDFYFSLISIPQEKQNIFNKLCSNSCIGTLVWSGLYRLSLVTNGHVEQYEKFQSSLKTNSVFIQSRFALIEKACADEERQLLYTVIPDQTAFHNQNRETVVIDAEAINSVFGQRRYWMPLDLIKANDFPKGDYHFNNEGSIRFANFLEKLIRKEVKNASRLTQ